MTTWATHWSGFFILSSRFAVGQNFICKKLYEAEVTTYQVCNKPSLRVPVMLLPDTGKAPHGSTACDTRWRACSEHNWASCCTKSLVWRPRASEGYCRRIAKAQLWQGLRQFYTRVIDATVCTKPTTYLPSSAATYREIAVLKTRRLECIKSRRASLERMPGMTIRKIRARRW